MQFIVIAYDGTDDKALDRRMAVRDAHLKQFKEMYDKGQALYGVGILDDAGKLIGSMIVCDFASREELNSLWLKNEPYIVGKVWEKIEIRRAQVPPFCARK
jgi:uncharacterized protein YciI